MLDTGKILSKLKEKGLEPKTTIGEPMKNHTTFKIGGKAALFIEPADRDEMCSVIRALMECGISPLILGRGSNILVDDAGIDNAVVSSMSALSYVFEDEENVIRAGAGISLSKASSFAAEKGLSGMEFAHGIPGTVGGAVYMNAGAYGGDMSSIVEETLYLDPSGKLCLLKGSEHGFGYRESFFTKNSLCTIIETKMRLCRGDKKEIIRKIDDLNARRRDKQPLDMPSAGSVFKRPEGYFAGRLIEEAGLKGKTIGGAAVSEKHAGFIVNRGDATCRDVLELIEFIQNEVERKSGIKLSCEIKYVK